MCSIILIDLYRNQNLNKNGIKISNRNKGVYENKNTMKPANHIIVSLRWHAWLSVWMHNL